MTKKKQPFRSDWEMAMILKRTLPGRLAAKHKGKRGGRPKKLNPDQVILARHLYADSKNSVHYICTVLGISKPTFYSYLRA